MKVICNKSKDCLCSSCYHGIPHEKRSYDGAYCTEWDTCYEFPDGQGTAIRCTRVKNEDPQLAELLRAPEGPY